MPATYAANSGASAHSGWDDLDEGLVTDVVTDDADSAEWSPRRAIFDDGYGSDGVAARASIASAGRTILLAVGFVLLVGVEAGAAALVVRERFAQLFH